MSVVEGFEVLTGSYLGQDWEIFGETPDDAIIKYARGHSPDAIASSIAGLQDLLESSMTEQELHQRWIYELGSGYDPRRDFTTYRAWFAHALDLLRREAAGGTGGTAPQRTD